MDGMVYFLANFSNFESFDFEIKRPFTQSNHTRRNQPFDQSIFGSLYVLPLLRAQTSPTPQQRTTSRTHSDLSNMFAVMARTGMSGKRKRRIQGVATRALHAHCVDLRKSFRRGVLDEADWPFPVQQPATPTSRHEA